VAMRSLDHEGGQLIDEEDARQDRLSRLGPPPVDTCQQAGRSDIEEMGTDLVSVTRQGERTKAIRYHKLTALNRRRS
jgi:hypothetical protein